jgi:hypothetical protein
VPQLSFFYNYIVRLGLLDGREGLLLHLYHSTYTSWKYAKAWYASRSGASSEQQPGAPGELVFETRATPPRSKAS